MLQNELMLKLKEFGFNNQKEYTDDAFSRNIGLLTNEEQQHLQNVKIAIPGMGGVGGLHLISLVRSGIGKFNLADFDSYEAANVNRQYGARVSDFGKQKLDVMADEALNINPYLEITKFDKGINSENIDDFLQNVDIVVDSLDFFAFEERRLLFNKAREKGIYVITAGPLGFSSAMLIFSPHEGMTFDEYFDISEKTLEKKYLHFLLGLSPKHTFTKYTDLSKINLDAKAGPSLYIACQLCAALVSTEVLRIVLKRGKVKSVPHYFQFDPYTQQYKKGYLYGGNRNLIQRLKIWIVGLILKRKKG